MGFSNGGMQVRRDAVVRVKGMKGCMRGRMQEMREAGLEGCRTGDMQERRDSGKEVYRK